MQETPEKTALVFRWHSVKPMTQNVSCANLVVMLSWRESESDGYENRITPLSDTQLNLCKKVKKVSNKFYSKISVPQHSTTSHITEAQQFSILMSTADLRQHDTRLISQHVAGGLTPNAVVSPWTQSS